VIGGDALDLSKIEAGQLVLELSDYCIQDIAQTVRSTLEPLATDKKLAFKIEMAAELPPGRGGRRRLTQVLINRVGNAIKFTDAGEVAIKAEANNGAFHVSVCDTGPGISAADQAKLFQEFQQGSVSVPCTCQPRQSPQRDCAEMSSSFATAADRLGPYILTPSTGRPHSQASTARHGSNVVRMPVRSRARACTRTEKSLKNFSPSRCLISGDNELNLTKARNVANNSLVAA
jgi:hypothetical protein